MTSHAVPDNIRAIIIHANIHAIIIQANIHAIVPHTIGEIDPLIQQMSAGGLIPQVRKVWKCMKVQYPKETTMMGWKYIQMLHVCYWKLNKRMNISRTGEVKCNSDMVDWWVSYTVWHDTLQKQHIRLQTVTVTVLLHNEFYLSNVINILPNQLLFKRAPCNNKHALAKWRPSLSLLVTPAWMIFRILWKDVT